MVSKVKEYGCGVYGCVIPTLDPAIVMKLTTDDTEAQFAAQVADQLVAPICVNYHMVLETKVKHERRTVYLLWRDSADDVGRIRNQPNGEWAVHYINKQHAAAGLAFRALRAEGMTKETDRLLVEWAESCEAMARQTQFPDLRELGDGLVENWGQLSILFGDIHEGNLGKVNGKWVITDPGNIAVVDRTLVKNPARRGRVNPGEQDIAARVNAAARKVATGPGRSVAYIVDVWKQLERDGGNPGGVSYDEFRCELINLYRSSAIGLQPAKDKRSAAAKASELEIGSAVFHVVTVGQAARAAAPAKPLSPATAPPRSHAVSDTDFARIVNEIASDAGPDDRFGDRKVFISKIWDVASVDPDIASMGLSEFKRRLVAAHQGRRLVLSRADLVSAMDPELVRKSETQADGATFHFVQDQRFKEAVRPAPVPAHSQPERVDILGAVKKAAIEMPAAGRFGPDKVFVSEIWRVISQDPRIAAMGLPAFKRWLVAGNRDGLIDLRRADLVGAMNRDQVAASEINDLGATFHFVSRDRWGTFGY